MSILAEPDPRNVAKLRTNLRDYEGRWELAEAAIGVTDGTADFAYEPTGRYGGIGRGFGDTIAVQVRAANDVLRQVLERESHIDVLKIDIEGLEVPVLEAIDPGIIQKVDLIYYETADRGSGWLPEPPRAASCSREWQSARPLRWPSRIRQCRHRRPFAPGRR